MKRPDLPHLPHTRLLPLLAATAALTLGACSTTPPPAPAAAPKPVAAPAPAPAAPAPAPAVTKPAPAAPVASAALPPYLDPKNPISTERSVYFDFDEYTVKPQYDALIERQGKYLSANPSLAVKVEGNCDERGSREYNLALGQRRAEAVVRALKIYGVKDAQMEPVSWGEDKPVALGHDEASWAKNRRADIQYPKK